MKFPFYNQLDSESCGPTCIRMIAKYYGKIYSHKMLAERCFITHGGVSMLGISEAAESIGFRTSAVRLNFDQLVNDISLPCIVHWKQNHFVVLYRISTKSTFSNWKRSRITKWIYIADPAGSLVKYTASEFSRAWISTKKDGEEKGHCLLLEPTPEFYQMEGEKPKRKDIWFLLKHTFIIP